jgi:fimbrial chaperone protein
MDRRKSWAGVTTLAFAGIAACLPGRAIAQALQVSPISVELQPGQMTTTLAVTNQGSEPTVLQMRPFLWGQANDADELTATDALLVSPPITDVPAGETQTFRLVLEQPAEAAEASYRLLLDELPPPAMASGVRIALRISIPVFAEPQTITHAELHWRLDATDDGDVLVGTNSGAKHLRIVNPVLVESNGRKLALTSAETPYILPGAEQRWPLGPDVRLIPGSTVHLVAMSDIGPVDAAVHVSEP